MKKIILFLSLLFALPNANAEEIKLNCIFESGLDGQRSINPSYQGYSTITRDVVILLDEKKRSIVFLEFGPGKITEWNDQKIIVDHSSYDQYLRKTISRISTLSRYSGKMERIILGDTILNYNCNKANKKF